MGSALARELQAGASHKRGGAAISRKRPFPVTRPLSALSGSRSSILRPRSTGRPSHPGKGTGRSTRLPQSRFFQLWPHRTRLAGRSGLDLSQTTYEYRSHRQISKGPPTGRNRAAWDDYRRPIRTVNVAYVGERYPCTKTGPPRYPKYNVSVPQLPPLIAALTPKRNGAAPRACSLEICSRFGTQPVEGFGYNAFTRCAVHDV